MTAGPSGAGHEVSEHSRSDGLFYRRERGPGDGFSLPRNDAAARAAKRADAACRSARHLMSVDEAPFFPGNTPGQAGLTD